MKTILKVWVVVLMFMFIISVAAEVWIITACAFIGLVFSLPVYALTSAVCGVGELASRAKAAAPGCTEKVCRWAGKKSIAVKAAWVEGQGAGMDDMSRIPAQQSKVDGHNATKQQAKTVS